MSDWLSFDREELARDFNARSFRFSHCLHHSPLFELSRLSRLADDLFAKGGKRDVYNAAAGKGAGDRFNVNGDRSMTPGEAVNEIATSGSWVVMKRIEQDPEYRAIVDQCVAELASAVPAFGKPHIEKAEGFIFVTSPGGVTPYHIDPQWSFLAQIRGPKRYSIYDVKDPAVVSEAEIEAFHAGDVNAAKYAPEKDAKASVYALKPGDAVNQPVYAPHVAKVGDDYSISLSIAIVSDVWSDLIPLRLANHRLRKAGLRPSPIGANPPLDAMKSFAWRAASRIGRDLGMGRAD